MKLFWKLFLSVCSCIMLLVSIGGTVLIQAGFHNAREKDIETGFNNTELVCFNLIQNSKRTTSLQYVDFEYQYEKDVILKKTAKSLSVQNVGENVVFTLWNEKHDKLYSNQVYLTPDYTLNDKLKDAQAGYTIIRDQDSYYLYTGRCFTMFEKQYFVETLLDITETYESRESQIRTFRVILLFVMFVCVLMVFILNNMILVPIKRLSKATKFVANGRVGLRIKKHGKDEIGMLAEDFNRMSISLNKTMEELKEKTRSQEMFTNNFAHELKTPLTSMIGYADIIRSTKLPEEELVTYANQIVLEGRRLEKMSMKLMELIVLKKQDFLMYDIDVKTFLASVYETLLPVAEKYGIKLMVAADPAQIKIEPDLMKTVFINLFDNARKAMPDAGNISVYGMWERDGYTITVADSGCGIDAEHLSHLTEAFYMVDKSRSRANGGAGLGLAICNEIVHLHGAKLRIESEVGKGTKVSVCFAPDACRQPNTEGEEDEYEAYEEHEEAALQGQTGTE